MREEKIYFVYILASGKNATLYIGITNDLQARILQHRGVIPAQAGIQKKSFTQKYKVN